MNLILNTILKTIGTELRTIPLMQYCACQRGWGGTHAEYIKQHCKGFENRTLIETITYGGLVWTLA